MKQVQLKENGDIRRCGLIDAVKYLLPNVHHFTVMSAGRLGCLTTAKPYTLVLHHLQ